MSELLSRRWLGLLAVAALAMVVCVIAGQWQWGRYQQRSQHNAQVAANAAAPALAATDVLPAAPQRPATDNEWRRVTARGEYDLTRTVVLRNRSIDGTPGVEVFVPLRGADGTAVWVDRGWQPTLSSRGVPGAPGGEVGVIGRLRIGEVPADDELGRSDGPPLSVSRFDPVRLADSLPYPVRGGYLELLDEQPAMPGLRELPVVTAGTGLNLAYTVQWYLFAGLIPVGLFFLRRRERDEHAAAPASTHETTSPA